PFFALFGCGAGNKCRCEFDAHMSPKKSDVLSGKHRVSKTLDMRRNENNQGETERCNKIKALATCLRRSEIWRNGEKDRVSEHRSKVWRWRSFCPSAP